MDSEHNATTERSSGRALLQRFGFAFQGIRAAWGEPNFRIHVVAGISVLALLFWLRPPPHWWAILLLAVGGVLSCEMLNSSLERLLDRLHPEIHPDIKIAKDCAAGAVLILALTSLAIFTAFLWSQW